MNQNIEFLDLASKMLERNLIEDCLDFFNKVGLKDITNNELQFYVEEIAYLFEKELAIKYEILKRNPQMRDRILKSRYY